ncbi:MAG TPA: NAD(P)-dependent oxidoreductase, partial [Candidatus Goldiibacteriota bacterium]|nr:NAD(P)-dependent oxidoreductase [Candidatus Goldiibacteriota bacterium]
MAKLVVTGGCGFLGFHVCKKLAKKYSKILVVDIDTFRKEEYPKNVIYQKLDVRDAEGLKKAFRGYDAVVNAAAALPLWKPKDIYTVNVDGMVNVLEAARKNGIKRVVQISSTAVYGVPDHHPLYEYDELVGVGPYGETKIKAERICEEYRKKGMIVSVIRPKTFIGTERLGVFQILYDWVEAGALIPCIGNGENRYQLLEVLDLVDAIELCLKKPAKIANDTFNVGAKNTKPVKEYLEEFFRRVNSRSRVMKTPAVPLIMLLEIFWMLRVSPLYKWVYGTAHKDSFVS